MVIATYGYDGLGRRTVKIVRQVDGEDVTYQRTDYLYDEQWQVLEERTDTFEDLEGEGGALATVPETASVQWLWDARYVDAPVLRWRDADAQSGNGLEETLYVCDDANMNVTALVSASGTVEERYVYEVYGKPAIFDGGWQPVTWAESEQNEVLYCGYRWDFETGLYQVRFRYYQPGLGRWIGRDDGYREGANLYAYVGNSPIMSRDRLGRAAAPARDVIWEEKNEDGSKDAPGGKGIEPQWVPQPKIDEMAAKLGMPPGKVAGLAQKEGPTVELEGYREFQGQGTKTRCCCWFEVPVTVRISYAIYLSIAKGDVALEHEQAHVEQDYSGPFNDPTKRRSLVQEVAAHKRYGGAPYTVNTYTKMQSTVDEHGRRVQREVVREPKNRTECATACRQYLYTVVERLLAPMIDEMESRGKERDVE